MCCHCQHSCRHLSVCQWILCSVTMQQGFHLRPSDFEKVNRGSITVFKVISAPLYATSPFFNDNDSTVRSLSMPIYICFLWSHESCPCENKYIIRLDKSVQGISGIGCMLGAWKVCCTSLIPTEINSILSLYSTCPARPTSKYQMCNFYNRD